MEVAWECPVVDIDSHVFEPEGIWDRYVPAQLQGIARQAFWHHADARGNETVVLNGAPVAPMSRHKINRQAIWRPGMTPDDIGALDPRAPHPINPGASDAAQRLADMDALGIDHAIAYPTLFAEYFPLVRDPFAAAVLAQAYNDWAADLAAASRGRVHPVAVLPLQSVALALEELERVAGLGFRGVFLRPMLYPHEPVGASYEAPVPRDAIDIFHPSPGVSLMNERFAPLWRRIDQLGLVACVHGSPGSTNPEGTSPGTFIERVAGRMQIGHPVAESVAYMQDAALFLSIVCNTGLLEDLPTLKVSLAHGGSIIAVNVLERAETFFWIFAVARILAPLPISLEPEHVIDEHPFLVSFDSWETAVARTPARFVDKSGWGSRYPHHDASTPAEAFDLLRRHDVDDATIARLMGGNALELFGLQVGVGV